MSTYRVSFFQEFCSVPTDAHSSACNGELTSVTSKALRKPQSLASRALKRSTGVRGSYTRIRSR